MVTKILKMDESNQYGNAMTKPLPIGGIKKSKKILSMREFHLVIQGISDEDKMGHLFVVDIKFDTKYATKNNYFSTKFIHQFLRKIKFYWQMKDFLLLGAMRLNDRGTIHSFKTTTKTLVNHG